MAALKLVSPLGTESNEFIVPRSWDGDSGPAQAASFEALVIALDAIGRLTGDGPFDRSWTLRHSRSLFR